MKRRTFMQIVGAGFAAPATPSIAVSVSATQSVAPVAGHFSIARLIARSHNKCSRPMLMRHLKVDAGTAARLEAMLLEKGIITLPDVAGVSKAVNPIIANPLPQAVKALQTPNASLGHKMDEIAQKVLETDLDQSSSTPVSEPKTETDPETR